MTYALHMDNCEIVLIAACLIHVWVLPNCYKDFPMSMLAMMSLSSTRSTAPDVAIRALAWHAVITKDKLNNMYTSVE